MMTVLEQSISNVQQKQFKFQTEQSRAQAKVLQEALADFKGRRMTACTDQSVSIACLQPELW